MRATVSGAVPVGGFVVMAGTLWLRGRSVQCRSGGRDALCAYLPREVLDGKARVGADCGAVRFRSLDELKRQRPRRDQRDTHDPIRVVERNCHADVVELNAGARWVDLERLLDHGFDPGAGEQTADGP